MPDRCPILLDCEQGFHMDNDGCPDPAIGFDGKTGRITPKSAALLKELVAEIAGLKGRLTHLRLVGYAGLTKAHSASTAPTAPRPQGSGIARAVALGLANARTVMQWLVRHGVPAGILVVTGRAHKRVGDRTVAFEVVSCNGKPRKPHP